MAGGHQLQKWDPVRIASMQDEEDDAEDEGKGERDCPSISGGPWPALPKA